MKVDAPLGTDLARIPERVRRLESAGYDGVRTAELANDPFFPLLLAAEHSERPELSTSIAVAFARSPMLLANIGNDLQGYSGGRLILGLGSQIRPHIEKRFSMPWGAPAEKMRELVLAMRAIWAHWYDGARLDFIGRHYRHTLMTPNFTPTDNRFGAPRVHLAAVGPRMTEVAGEVADGMIVHGFSTIPFIRTVTLPAIERGLARAGRAREGFEIAYSPMIVSGETEEAMRAADTRVRERIAFYASTPAYRGVLDSIGAGDLQPELNRMSKEGRWQEMGTRIDDSVLREFAIVGEPHEIVPEWIRRCAGIVDRTSSDFGFAPPDVRGAMIDALRAAPATAAP